MFKWVRVLATLPVAAWATTLIGFGMLGFARASAAPHLKPIFAVLAACGIVLLLTLALAWAGYHRRAHQLALASAIACPVLYAPLLSQRHGWSAGLILSLIPVALLSSGCYWLMRVILRHQERYRSHYP